MLEGMIALSPPFCQSCTHTRCLYSCPLMSLTAVFSQSLCLAISCHLLQKGFQDYTCPWHSLSSLTSSQCRWCPAKLFFS